MDTNTPRSDEDGPALLPDSPLLWASARMAGSNIEIASDRVKAVAEGLNTAASVWKPCTAKQCDEGTSLSAPLWTLPDGD